MNRHIIFTALFLLAFAGMSFAEITGIGMMESSKDQTWTSDETIIETKAKNDIIAENSKNKDTSNLWNNTDSVIDSSFKQNIN